MDGIRRFMGTGAEGLTAYSTNFSAASATAIQTAASQGGDAMMALKQAAVGKEIAEFGDAVQLLSNKLRVFSSGGMFATYYKMSGNGDGFSSFVRNSLTGLVDAYNKVNGVIKSSGYVTEEGKLLLDGVQALFKGKDGQAYLDMGLKLNEDTGNIKLDERKLADFLSKDAAQVSKLLVGKQYLAPVLQNIVQDVLGKRNDYYFCRPFSASV